MNSANTHFGCQLCEEHCMAVGIGYDFYSCKKYWKIKTEEDLFLQNFSDNQILKINQFLVDRNQKKNWQEIITSEMIKEVLNDKE